MELASHQIVAMIAIPTAILLAATVGILTCLSSHHRQRDFVSIGNRKVRDTFASNPDVAWIPTTTVDPRPLLHLALQRYAASKGKHLERVENLDSRVIGAWQETSRDPKVDGDPDVDRWYRWRLRACIYDPEESFGSCRLLEVRARTSWDSGTPPSSWPVEFLEGVEDPSPAPTTGDLLLLQGRIRHP